MKQTRYSESRTIVLDRHTIELTHQNKILFPKMGFTKKDLACYYGYISLYMLPYLHNRPLTLHRFIEGVEHEGFYQKDVADYFPSWIKRVAYKKSGGVTIHYALANNAASLIYLTNQGTIEYHPWLARIDKIDKPDRMIFDLDPSGKATFALVVWTAQLIREFLEELHLPSYLMLTGSRGVHVLVPLKRIHTFDQTRSFAKSVAQHLATKYPTKLTTEMRLEKRGNRIFIDSFRNGQTQTAIAPYSVRARPYASVAVPLHWDELDNKKLTSDHYTIKTIHKRLDKVGDIWSGIQKKAVSLLAAIKRLEKFE